MKRIIALAIVGLIESAMQQSEGCNDIHSLANRMARLIPEQYAEYLITGVPVGVTVNDKEALTAILAKKTKKTVDEITVKEVLLEENFTIRIRYAYPEIRYSDSEEKAKQWENSEDWFNCATSAHDNFQFPFTALRADSITIRIEDAESYSLSVEMI